jgi:flagella basal body P-ring formation protein FlgA
MSSGLAAIVDGVPSARFAVQPSLTLWVTVPVAARDLAAGEAIAVVDAEVDLAKVVGLPVRQGTARVAIAAGRPVLESMVGAQFDAINGSSVELVYVRGNLVIAAEGRLLEDAKLGDSVRVVNEASRAVARGVLVTSDRVEIAR